MSDRIRVALIFGGQSSEHGISCLTAAGVLKAIDRDRFDVVGVGISRSGRWTQVPLETIAAYRIVDGRVPEVEDPDHDAVWMVGEHGCEVATRSGEKLVDINGVDVAFALLHGPFGEDGTIQGMFELMGIRYVGSGVTASAVGMDKHFMKVAFEAAGLPVWPYVVASGHRLRHDRAAVIREINETLTYPVFVKPARGGSSLGIVRVTGPEGLDAAIDEAQRFDPKIVVEQGFVGARELEVAVLGDPESPEGCRASGVGEIRVVAQDGFYDFHAKYIDENGAALDAPADVTPELAARLQSLAKQAYSAVDAEGLVRADFFVTDEGEWINEVNTMPGFTQISMYPTLWQEAGMTYPELVGRLIDLALARPRGSADVAGEFELIERITAGLVAGDDVVLSVGDDAAVLNLAGHVVVTTDMLIENVHFTRRWSPARAVGRKAVAVNVSDVEAMGARPSSVVVALAFPKDLDQEWVEEFETGAKEECVRAGVSLVGGDLSSSAHIAVCVTALGDLGGRAAVTRAGARPGDVVAVCGRLGWAAAGLAVLQRGFGSPKELVAEQQTPSVPYGQGAVAARAGATAMLDVSDGLLADLGHIAESSHVLIDVDTALIEIPAPVERVAAATGKPALGFVLAGGEDHALAATFPPGTPLPVGWRRVGEVREGEGILVDGAHFDGSLGWDHFA